MGGVLKSVSKVVGSLVGAGGQDMPSTPKVDPEAERLAAERDAATAANTRAAERNRQRRAGSLLSVGAGDDGGAQSILARGKSRLGE